MLIPPEVVLLRFKKHERRSKIAQWVNNLSKHKSYDLDLWQNKQNLQENLKVKNNAIFMNNVWWENVANKNLLQLKNKFFTKF